MESRDPPERQWPQYASQEFQEFAEAYGFKLVTSSPRYPQSNGQAERTVQTVKQLLKKQLQDRSADPYLTPWCGLSPAELLMGRWLRTSLPQTDKLLTPEWSYLPDFRKANSKVKDQQKRDFVRRHRVQDLPDLSEGTQVWVRSGERDPVPGHVVSTASRPRSYLVDVPTGQVQRNRKHLTTIPGVPPTPEHDEDISDNASVPHTQPSSRKIMTRSQTGTPILPPDRLA